MATAMQTTTMYASEQTPRVGDVVRGKGTRANPGERLGVIEKVYRADDQINPGRVLVRWQTTGPRTKERDLTRIKPDALVLVHCAGCDDEGMRMVPDGSGGVEWDACPRCCRIEDSGSAPALDDTPF